MAMIKNCCTVCGHFIADPDIPGHDRVLMGFGTCGMHPGMAQDLLGLSSTSVVLAIALADDEGVDFSSEPNHSPYMEPICPPAPGRRPFT